MKILYFTQFYQPESIAAAFRAKEHATIWAREGNDVTVFTGWPNYPTGHLFDGYQMVPLGREEIDGVSVLRSISSIHPNTSMLNRIQDGVSFAIRGLHNAKHEPSLKSGDFDVVVVTSGTVFSAWLGCHYSRKHRLPFVIEFRDLTWKQMVATGRSESNLVVRAMKRLELSFCKGAGAVVALTKGFKTALEEEGISADLISIVPNGADIVVCEHDWSKYGLRLGYFGTMGLSQDVPRTIQMVKGLDASGCPVSYTLIGEGATRSAVEERVVSGEYPFLTLHHGMPKNKLERYYAEVDMTVVSLQNTPSFASTIPSKIFQSFARGVPVVFLGPEGDAADFVRRSGGGIALCGNDDEVLARLVDFSRSPDLAARLQRMSENAIDFIQKNYTRQRMAEKMLTVFYACTRRVQA